MKFPRCGLSRYKILTTWALFFLLWPASGNAFLHKKIPPPKTGSSETPQYRIYYKTDPAAQKKTEKNMAQLFFKVVEMSEKPGRLLEPAGGGWVRFLDKQGFVLASRMIFTEDFQGQDAYGSVWIENTRVSKIVRADLKISDREEVLFFKDKYKTETRIEENAEEQLKKDLEAAIHPIIEASSSISPKPLVSAVPSPAVEMYNPPIIQTSPAPASPIPSASPEPTPSVSGPINAMDVSGSDLPAPETKKANAPEEVSPSPSAVPEANASASPAQVIETPISPSPSPSASPAASREDRMTGNHGTSNEDIQRILGSLNRNNSAVAEGRTPEPSVQQEEAPSEEAAPTVTVLNE